MTITGFDKVALVSSFVCVSTIFASRAPTFINELNLFGLKFNLNVGYIVIFSIPIILLLLTWFWISRDRTILSKKLYERNHWLISFFVCFPAFSSLFMFIQFIQELAPSSECDTFSSIQYFNLLNWDYWGMKPKYCIEISDEIQNLMPYIYPPIQTWGYLCIVVGNIFLSFKLLKYYESSN